MKEYLVKTPITVTGEVYLEGDQLRRRKAVAVVVDAKKGIFSSPTGFTFKAGEVVRTVDPLPKGQWDQVEDFSEEEVEEEVEEETDELDDEGKATGKKVKVKVKKTTKKKSRK